MLFGIVGCRLFVAWWLLFVCSLFVVRCLPCVDCCLSVVPCSYSDFMGRSVLLFVVCCLFMLVVLRAVRCVWCVEGCAA